VQYGDVDLWVVPEGDWVSDGVEERAENSENDAVDGDSEIVSFAYSGKTYFEAGTTRNVDGELENLLIHWWRRLTVEDDAWRQENPQSGTFQMIPPGQAAWQSGVVEPALIDFLSVVRMQLEATVSRFLGLLRWRHSLWGPARVKFSLKWSLDERGERWLSGEQIKWKSIGDIDPSEFLAVYDEDVAILQQAMTEGCVEPIAREVLVEAMGLEHSSPRAALVLAVAAAEIGTRSYGRELRPVSETWLVQQPQQPSVDALLSKYLPLLTTVRTRDGRGVIPVKLRKHVREAIETRNQIVHHGGSPPDDETLKAYLQAISDLLYILDWLDGESWALSRVSSQWRDEYRQS
jgi:hypothetical protein